MTHLDKLREDWKLDGDSIMSKVHNLTCEAIKKDVEEIDNNMKFDDYAVIREIKNLLKRGDDEG
jgi:hypothetical protein